MCYLPALFLLFCPALQAPLFASRTTYRSGAVGVAADHKLGFMDIYYGAAIDGGGRPPADVLPPEREASLFQKVQAEK